MPLRRSQQQPQQPQNDLFAPRVLERSYAAPDALGDQPTMNYFNPRWAQWFDAVKERTGGNPVFANQGGLRKLPNSPTGDEDQPYSSASALKALRQLIGQM